MEIKYTFTKGNQMTSSRSNIYQYLIVFAIVSTDTCGLESPRAIRVGGHQTISLLTGSAQGKMCRFCCYQLRWEWVNMKLTMSCWSWSCRSRLASRRGNNERISQQGLNPKTRLWKLMLPWEMGVSTSHLRYAVDGNVGDETT
jgi:hypothetical protein